MGKIICPAVRLLQSECKDCPAVIKSLSQIDVQTARRLTRLGVCEGCPISAVKRPGSDPIVFEINSAHIALRKHEAEKLMVEVENYPINHI